MKRQKETDKNYEKVYDKRKKLYGIKKKGERTWYIKPCFQNVDSDFWTQCVKDEIWFRQNGKYGLICLPERRIVLPPVYGYPIDFHENGQAMTWKDYKAGVIDREGNELIPFIYDRMERRYERVNQHQVFRGYACFCNDGTSQAYDENCQPNEFTEEEKRWNAMKREYENKEVETMTLDELETLIKKEYVKLMEMGYGGYNDFCYTREHKDKVDVQKDRVESLLSDRRLMMNRSWVHNEENARRIGRLNDLLMRAVYKAFRLLKKTSQSLLWMENVQHVDDQNAEVYVHPEWQDSRSELNYVRKFESEDEEDERLVDEEDNLSHTHIWNIIAQLGHGCRHDRGFVACFEQSWNIYMKDDLEDFEDMVGEDGRTWDECIHYPAYQDQYFLMPFHHLYCDLFDYSLEDLCHINDFRVNVEVRLETREQDKHGEEMKCGRKE